MSRHNRRSRRWTMVERNDIVEVSKYMVGMFLFMFLFMTVVTGQLLSDQPVYLALVIFTISAAGLITLATEQ